MSMDREAVFLPGCEKLYHFGEGGLVIRYYNLLQDTTKILNFWNHSCSNKRKI